MWTMEQSCENSVDFYKDENKTNLQIISENDSLTPDEVKLAHFVLNALNAAQAKDDDDYAKLST